MTPEQRQTLEWMRNWMRRTRREASPASQAILVNIGSGQGLTTAIIYPDGSYSIARLGAAWEPPGVRGGS